MKSTVVELTVASVKKSQNLYNKEHPYRFEIEVDVPYDTKSIFYQMSGGTKLILNTINEKAAELFEIGGVMVMTIHPKPKEVQPESE